MLLIFLPFGILARIISPYLISVKKYTNCEKDDS